MDFSDDSFAWTDASSDSSIMTTPGVENDDHDDSDIDYKKKIQKKLFEEQPTEGPLKKKKRKASQMLDTSPINTNKSIKIELESDLEAPKKKKKRTNTESEDKFEQSQDTLLAEDYLNFRVKQEQLSFAEPEPVKKKKKKRKKEKDSGCDTQDSESTETSIVRNEEVDNEYDNSLNNFDENMVQIDKFEAEETVVQKKKKKRKHESKSNTSREDNSFQEESMEKIADKTEEVEQTHITNGNLESDSDFEPKRKIKSTAEIKALKSKKKPPQNESNENSTRISDRITFEDEESVDSEKLTGTMSKQLQQYVNVNTNLKPYISEVEKENIITDDDEVWVLNIPKEVDIKALKDFNLTLDTKWKVKINGHSYDGVVENHLSQIPLLCYKRNKCYIKNVPLMGEVCLRKRIPKAHIPQESCMINNQTNFIPLPETKCRHPLFGIDYKKAIKIPSTIAERLNGTVEKDASESFSGKKEKKKKHKKEKRKVEKESEPEDATVMDTTQEQESRSKKKRKRKHSEDTTKSKKSKRAKPDPDSAEAWESERAIEENLFNF